MKKITIEFCGATFKIKNDLTRKLDLPDWVIFYDNISGLWAYNIKTSFSVWLNSKYIPLNYPSIDIIIEEWRKYIRHRERLKEIDSETTEN